jgi:DNA (cytosine-5)-methyltransferase 1
MAHSFTFVDLFSGIGGFHHALSQLGGRCVLASEIDDDARKVYENSFPRLNGHTYEFVKNIRTLTRDDPDDSKTLKSPKRIAALVPDHDLLCGGFPCQPFSKSGEQRGWRDKTRGTLFHDIIQIVEAKRPKYVFLENVRNIAGPRHADTWNVVLSSIRDLGYLVPEEPLIFSPHLLPPTMGGAPQVRERVFILAARKDVGGETLSQIQLFNQRLRRKIFWNPESWRISSFIDADETIKNLKDYQISETEDTYLKAWNFFVKKIETDRLPGFPLWAFAFTHRPEIRKNMPEWEVSFRKRNSLFYNDHKQFIDDWLDRKWGRSKLTVRDFPISRQKFEWQAASYHRRKVDRRLDDLVLQFRPSGIRVKPPTYLPALVAITQTSIIGPKLRSITSRGYRKLTPKEAARLQSLPEAVYSDSVVADGAAYKQLGNAVNVGIVKIVAQLLLGQCHETHHSLRSQQASFDLDSARANDH